MASGEDPYNKKSCCHLLGNNSHYGYLFDLSYKEVRFKYYQDTCIFYLVFKVSDPIRQNQR